MSRVGLVLQTLRIHGQGGRKVNKLKIKVLKLNCSKVYKVLIFIDAHVENFNAKTNFIQGDLLRTSENLMMKMCILKYL